jgi:hypothetical protein
MDHVSNKILKSEQKQADYHSLLNVVLAPLSELQSFSGLTWELCYKNQMYDVSLKIPILFITGDSEGQDKLVGRRIQYHNLSATAHICRYCNIPYGKTDDPCYKKRKLTKASMIEEYLLDQNPVLQEIGYLNIQKNSLHKLAFCDIEYGLNGSVPADLLHTFQLGIYIYAIEGLFGQKKASSIALKKSRKRRKKKDAIIHNSDDSSSQSESSIDEILKGEDRSSLNIFNDKECDSIDRIARLYGKKLSQQSDRNLPRTFFPNGITGDKKKNGHEMQGVILNLLFIFMSDEFDKFRSNFGGDEIGSKRLGSWILLLERLIMVEEFLKQSSFLKKDVECFKKWFPGLLNLFKKVVDRQTSTQLRLLKFHLCTHFADDIIKWGIPSAYNSSTGESNHKMLKRRSRKTQRQQNVMEEQTGVRYIEHISLHQSLNSCQDLGFQHCRQDRDQTTSERTNEFSGYSYYVTKDGIFDVTGKGRRNVASWFNQGVVEEDIFDVLRFHVLPNIGQERIDCMTVLKSNGFIFRGDPSFKKTMWQDWAYCNWGEHGLIPIQILLYVNLTKLQNEFEYNGVAVSHPGNYAIVHMLKQPLDTDYADEEGNICNYHAHEKSILFYKASKMMDDTGTKAQIALVSTDSIASPCVAVSCDPNNLLHSHTYVFMRSRDEWPELLVLAIKKGLREKTIV